MAVSSSSVLRWTPRRNCFSVKAANQRSTRLSQEAPVGVRGKEGAWKPMPKGWYFGRVSMVANDMQSNVYVLHRNGDIDPLVVFDAEGNYLRSWGKGVIDDPHGIRVDSEVRSRFRPNIIGLGGMDVHTRVVTGRGVRDLHGV